MAPESEEKPKLIRETDDEARRLARTLVRGAGHMALAVIDPQTGFPSVSRVLTATDLDGVPVILVSGLSNHTKALLADPRCSLLAGEPGKGDPLAHPRITVQAIAESVERDTANHARIRTRFLTRHPKSALYIDFPDFRFFRITPKSASLNGGFARAYALCDLDFVISDVGDANQWLEFTQKLNDMSGLADRFSAKINAPKSRNWSFGGIDKAGINLISKDFQLRHEADEPFESPKALLDYILQKAKLG